MSKRLLVLVCSALLSTCFSRAAEEVLGFRGKNQQGFFAEKDLLKSWPVAGLKPLWVYAELGAGWGSPVIAGKRIFITGSDPSDTKMEMLTCLNSKGEKRWSVRLGEAWSKSYPGARTTPTYVAGEKRREGHLYVFTGSGVLVCVAEKDGRIIWQQNVAQDYQGKPGSWGFAECVTVAEGKVFASPGGDKASMVAFDLKTGKVVWETPALRDRTGYIAPVLLKGQLIQVGAKYIFGVDVRSGKLKWKLNYMEYGGKRGEINCNPVLVKGSQILVSSGYDHGAVMLELQPSGDDVKVRWSNPELDSHHGGLVEYNGKIYASNWTNNSTGNWICVDWNSGKTLYDSPWENLGKGQIVAADGMLYLYEEKRGTVALAKPNPVKLDIVSKFPFNLGSKEHWAHPVICDGKLYLRRGNALAVYDIRATSQL
ncbi:MAG: PQQ-binding-like beta-propeller repeat protein [Lentisphaeria bacterium]